MNLKYTCMKDKDRPLASVYAYDADNQAHVLCILFEPETDPQEQRAVKSTVVYRDKHLTGEAFTKVIYGFGFYETCADAVRHVAYMQLQKGA